MLYDLNIAWSPTTSADDLTRTLRFSASLGYDVVALNHTISPPIPPQITNPIPEFSSSSSSSSSSPSTNASKNGSKQNNSPPLPTVLRRATLLFSDPSQQHRIPQLAAAYDILALRPQTEKAFQAACLNVLEASLISLDLASRLPFYFRPKPCMAAVNRGVRFEVCYSQVLASPSSSSSAASPPDARARATFIGNVAQLVRATRGRGIVLSSEARGVLGLRAPADVVNLLHVWGLPRERAAEALGPAPRGVVVNEGIRRSGFRGVVDIVGVAVREGQQQPPPKRKGDVGTSLATGAKKRKNGGDGENAEAEGTGTGTNTPTTAAGVAAVEGDDQQQQQLPLSKRQAKKLKAALRKKHVSGDDEQKQA
ncbi:RNase P subunit p30-domain-containing protein [Biscogniauxia sp. FL1348]|nr:RNase P subunit p30-domain-containing protein [Biscogniauxia sp. FL1348]